MDDESYIERLTCWPSRPSGERAGVEGDEPPTGNTRKARVAVLYLDELGPEHLGPDGHYTAFLEGKLIQSEEQPPNFVSPEWVQTPHILWRWGAPAVVPPRRRNQRFTPVRDLPALAPHAWLDHLKDAGAGVPRMRVAREIANYADHDTGQGARPSNATVAQTLGLTRESVNRAMRRLVADGWLTPTGKASAGVVVYALTTPEAARGMARTEKRHTTYK